MLKYKVRFSVDEIKKNLRIPKEKDFSAMQREFDASNYYGIKVDKSQISEFMKQHLTDTRYRLDASNLSRI